MKLPKTVLILMHYKCEHFVKLVPFEIISQSVRKRRYQFIKIFFYLKCKTELPSRINDRLGKH